MHIVIVLTLVLHVLSGVFWAGSTFTLARMGGPAAEKLLRPQMGCAGMVVVTGALLWFLIHTGGTPGTTEHILALGALAAIAAAAVQGMGLRAAGKGAGSEGSITAQSGGAAVMTQRIAALFLAVAVICMAAARYA
ncbi:MAG: hypothetical protein J2P50_09460 [Hyphomicrobiaceae bacterium]|nr:hypothetical protein [Hyphomicrobiaceae bacterium]